MPNVRKAIRAEQEVVGDLTNQFIAKDIRMQHRKSYSAGDASGSIAVAYYRGRQTEQEEIIKIIKRKFPKQSKAIIAAIKKGGID